MLKAISFNPGAVVEWHLVGSHGSPCLPIVSWFSLSSPRSGSQVILGPMRFLARLIFLSFFSFTWPENQCLFLATPSSKLHSLVTKVTTRLDMVNNSRAQEGTKKRLGVSTPGKLWAEYCMGRDALCWVGVLHLLLVRVNTRVKH